MDLIDLLLMILGEDHHFSLSRLDNVSTCSFSLPLFLLRKFPL